LTMGTPQLFAVVRSSSGTAGLIQSVLADGVGVKVAVAVDSGIDKVAVGVTPTLDEQAPNNKTRIRISFFTKMIIAGEFFEINKLI